MRVLKQVPFELWSHQRSLLLPALCRDLFDRVNGCSIDESSVLTLSRHDKWLEDMSKAFTGRVIEFRFALNVGCNYYTYLWHTVACINLCNHVYGRGQQPILHTKFHLYVQYVCMAIECRCILHVPFSCNIVMFCFILFGAVLFEYHWDTVVVLSIFEIIFIILCFAIFVSFSSFFLNVYEYV